MRLPAGSDVLTFSVSGLAKTAPRRQMKSQNQSRRSGCDRPAGTGQVPKLSKSKANGQASAINGIARVLDLSGATAASVGSGLSTALTLKRPALSFRSSAARLRNMSDYQKP
jgi:hypothetical protein